MFTYIQRFNNNTARCVDPRGIKLILFQVSTINLLISYLSVNLCMATKKNNTNFVLHILRA